jgi:Na+-translocating ferredoxin:NAD+ oxidoreductase RnfD subunit
VGHFWLGFEPSWAQAFVGIGVACAVQLSLELVDSWAIRRTPRTSGGMRKKVEFLLSAYIPGLNTSMLLFANDRLWPIAFAVGVAMASKWMFRAPVGEDKRHFFNPANFGIAVTLLLFPWVGISPPYQYTENLSGAADWLLPATLVMFGLLMNARFAKRLPLIGAWLVAFFLQATLRSLLLGVPLEGTLAPMTGMAFLLFTFYMVMDPPTSPSSIRSQVIFGASIAVVYGLLVAVTHVVFGLFFALIIVCGIRGMSLWVSALYRTRAQSGIGV